MPRFELHDPGVAFMSGIEKELMKRELARQQAVLEERQRRQDELAQRRFEEDIALRKQGQENLEGEKSFRRATTMATTMPKGELSGEAADLLKKEGYGGMFDMEASPEVPQSEIDTLKPSQIPGMISTEGGTAWRAARAQEQARADAQKAALDAKAEQERLAREQEERLASRDEALRRDIAGMRAGSDAEGRALRNELTELRIAAERTKQEAEAKGVDAAKKDSETLKIMGADLVDRLRNHEGMGAATGAYELRGFTQGAQDFNSLRNQLTGLVTVPNLQKIKLTPLSDTDLQFVKEVSTTLQNKNISDTALIGELDRLQHWFATGEVLTQGQKPATSLTAPKAATPARVNPFRNKNGGPGNAPVGGSNPFRR